MALKRLQHCCCYRILLHYFEITGGPCNLIGSNLCNYSRIALFLTLNYIFFPANEQATLQTKQPIRFPGLFKVPIKLQENERQRVSCSEFCNFCFQTLINP